MIQKWRNNLLVRSVPDDITSLFWFWKQYKRSLVSTNQRLIKKTKNHFDLM